MMHKSPYGKRIVRTRPGPGTLDTIYTDEDGGEWISTPFPPSTGGTTGEVRAEVRDGFLWPKRC